MKEGKVESLPLVNGKAWRYLISLSTQWVGDCRKIENYIPEAGFVHPEKTATGGGTDAESDSGLQNGGISPLEKITKKNYSFSTR